MFVYCCGTLALKADYHTRLCSVVRGQLCGAAHTIRVYDSGRGREELVNICLLKFPTTISEVLIDRSQLAKNKEDVLAEAYIGPPRVVFTCTGWRDIYILIHFDFVLACEIDNQEYRRIVCKREIRALQILLFRTLQPNCLPFVHAPIYITRGSRTER